MNKGVLIGIAVLLIVVAGVGSYMVISKSSDNKAASTFSDKVPTDETMSDNMVNGKLSDLLKLGQNYSCTFDHTDESGNNTSGTVYVASAGNKLRGDFTFTGNSESYDAGVIRDESYNYVWSSKFGGFKTKISDENSDIFSSDDTAASVGSIEDADVDFDCQRWTVNSSLFIPPSNIEFIDTEAMMEDLQSDTSEAMEGLDCSVCDNVPTGPSKDQCLSALGC